MLRCCSRFAYFWHRTAAPLYSTWARNVHFLLGLAGLSTLSAVAGPVDSAVSNPVAGPSSVMAMSLDELLDVNVDKVYGAARYEQLVSQAPASVSLVTRDEIQKQGYRTLADVMRSVNGVFVTDDRNYSYVGFRGFNRPGDYNSRVLLLVDGHRMNDNVYEQGLYGTEGFLDVDVIERVEVIRGPSSSIYGDNAFLGVVNVITRRGRDLNGLEATGEAGDNETFKAGLAYGKQFTNGLELLITGSFYDTAGESSIFFPEFNSPTNNNGVAKDVDADRAGHVFSTLSYGDFTLSGGWAWREKFVPTASYATLFNDGSEKTTDARGYVDLKYDHEFSESLRVIGRAAYDVATYEGVYPYAGTPTPVLNMDDSDGESFSTDWQMNWRLAERHLLVFGADYRENLQLQQRNFDENPPALYLDDERDGRNYGLFAQAELSLMTNLLFNAGIRYDHYSSFGDTWNPRLGLIFAPLPGSTFKLLYGEAFRAPNAYEQYYSYPGQAKANPDLDPETIRTYELVWEQELPWDLRLRTAGYYYDIDDLVSQVIDPNDDLAVFQNFESVNARGLEIELEKRAACGFVTRLGYALQRTEDEDSGSELSNSPEHMVKLNLIAPLYPEKVYLGLDLQYYSPVKTVMGGESDNVFLAHLTIFSRPLAKNLELSASIYNLFDERQGFSASNEHLQETIPLPGRSFRVKLTWRF